MPRRSTATAEDASHIKDLLERHGAQVSDDGIDDPKVAALEDEQREESLDLDEKAGRLEKLWDRIEALERQVSQSDARNDKLQADLAQANQMVKEVASKQGMDHQWQEFQTAAYMEDEAMKKEFQRIKTTMNGQAVIVVHHHHDPAQNRPIKGSINFRRFEVPRGIPVLCPLSVIEILYYMRRLTVEKYVEGMDGKKFRFVHERRAPFNIMSAGSHASAAIALR